MTILYVDADDVTKLLCESIDQSAVPQRGECVVLGDDAYGIQYVEWWPEVMRSGGTMVRVGLRNMHHKVTEQP